MTFLRFSESPSQTHHQSKRRLFRNLSIHYILIILLKSFVEAFFHSPSGIIFIRVFRWVNLSGPPCICFYCQNILHIIIITAEKNLCSKLSWLWHNTITENLYVNQDNILSTFTNHRPEQVFDKCKNVYRIVEECFVILVVVPSLLFLNKKW